MPERSNVTCAGIVVLFLILVGFLQSCEYEFAEFEEVDPTLPVSFMQDIGPIFTSSNNCTACHRAGATSPDLTEGNAFGSIVPALVDLGDPVASKIYAVPNPAAPGHGFKKYTQAQAGLVLAWIKQGAQNN